MRKRELEAEVERLRDIITSERAYYATLKLDSPTSVSAPMGDPYVSPIITTAPGLVSQVVTSRGAWPKVGVVITDGVERLVQSMNFEVEVVNDIEPDDEVLVIVARR